MTRFLVTGAHGFLGQHLIDELRARYPGATITKRYLAPFPFG